MTETREADQPEPQVIPLDEWLNISYIIGPISQPLSILGKKSPIIMDGITGFLQIAPVLGFGIPVQEGKPPDFYFDGFSDRPIRRDREVYREIEHQNENIQLVVLNLFFDDEESEEVKNTKWRLLLRFSSGSLLEKEYDPQEDPHGYQFQNIHWTKSTTQETFLDILAPASNHAFQKINMFLSRR